MNTFANILWVLVSIFCGFLAVMQFPALQDRADRGNLAGLIWEFFLAVCYGTVALHAWPY